MVGFSEYWKKLKAKKPQFRVRQPINEDNPMIFTIDEMMEATQSFSQMIGRGGFGTVFFGKLPDGKAIAVRVLSLKCKERFQEFLNEIDLLSRVHHKNLPPLLGYCTGPPESMVIYDYISEGSLKDHLHGQGAGVSKLNWKTRLKIAIDVAEALQYLHVCCTPMIIHRDVKTSNILVDSDLNGKLCDFSLSMMTMERKVPIEDEVKGTAGYLDPEYFTTQKFTQKSDVYGFGVVLLEIICGREPIKKQGPEEEIDIIRWVCRYVGINDNPRNGNMVEMIDKKMDGNYQMKSITIVAKLALRCVEATSSSRPSMSEVVGELKEAFMYERVKLHVSETETKIASGCQTQRFE